MLAEKLTSIFDGFIQPEPRKYILEDLEEENNTLSQSDDGMYIRILL